MHREAEYRGLLEKAQEAIEPIATLLAALQKDARANSSVRAHTEKIGESLRDLERELDQLWDEFKRL